MEKSENPIVYAAKIRRKRTIRIIKINRIVALILFVSIILCGIITFFAIQINDKYKIDSKSFYFIQMGQFTSSGDAMAKSLELKNAGASGYILNDGLFRVMATVFASKSDARTVENKLNTVGKECKIYEMKTPKITFGKYDGTEDAKKIRSLLTYPIERFFNELQKQDIALDARETTDSAALLAIGNLKKELAQRHVEIISFLSKYPADTILNSIEKTYKDILQSFSNYMPQNEIIVGTNIKTILCIVVEIYTFAFLR